MQIRNNWITTVYILLLAAPLAYTQSARDATSATVPRLVKYSGVVKDDAGHAKTGVVGVTFALYQDQEGGATLWLETQNVQADANGRYTVLLGSTKPDGLPAELFTTNEARWLGVQPEGQTEQPRVLFASVPYALKAADAETIGGLPPSAFVRAPEPGSNSANASASAASPTSSAAASVSGSGTTNFLPIWNSSTSLGNSTVFESGGKVGIGTTSPADTLDINGSAVVRGNQNVTGNLSIGTTPPATGPFRFQVETTNQLGAIVQGPFSGVGAGLDLQTTGTGGKQWEILATGKTSAQGAGKLNIRNINDGVNVLTVDTSDRVNIPELVVPGTVVTNFFDANIGSFGSGVIALGPVGIGPKFRTNLPFANLDVQGSNLDVYVGDPQCGAHPFAGIGFGSSGLTNCTNYSMVGNGVDTFVGAPSGNIVFRANSNSRTPMLITSGGQVGVGTTTPQETLDVAGRVRSQNLAAIATQSTLVNASTSDCLGALLSANSACDTPNLAITVTTGNVPIFIMANLNGIRIDSCVIANFGLVMDGKIITASNMNPVTGFAGSSLTMVSLQFPAPGSHTFEVQESDDTGGCSGDNSRSVVGSPSSFAAGNFSTRTLIVREF